MADFWTNMLWWLTQQWERFSAQPWVGHLQSSISDTARWLWGSGTPVVGGLMVLLAGVTVARAIREGGERKPRPKIDWVADRRGYDGAGRWRPTMALDHARRGALPAEAVSPIRPKRA